MFWLFDCGMSRFLILFCILDNYRNPLKLHFFSLGIIPKSLIIFYKTIVKMILKKHLVVSLFLRLQFL